MVTATKDDILGLGIYTPAEAAFYARVHTSTLKRWIHGNRSGLPVVDAQLAGDPERTITFLDFVQALAIRSIRRDMKISLQKIRDAVELAKDKYQVQYPFAMKHKTFVFGDEILIEIETHGLVRMSGTLKRQHVMKAIAEPYLQDVSFGADMLAQAYKAFEHQDRRIVMDPKKRLGQPVITGCRYTAGALWHAYRTEGSVTAAAKAYGVEQADVDLAIRYYDYLLGPLAA